MIAIQILLAATLIIMACVTIKNIRQDHAEGRSLPYLIPRLRKIKTIHKQSIPINPNYLSALFIFLVLTIILSNYYTEIHGNTWWVNAVKELLLDISCIYALLIMPRVPEKLGLTHDELLISHFIWFEHIKFDDILSIKVDSPDKDVKRISGSIGISGNWGKREDKSHGRYNACYGKRNKCLFVRLKNGDGYMLGAKDPEKFVEEVKKAMKEYRQRQNEV